jgi:hypothetical protein
MTPSGPELQGYLYGALPSQFDQSFGTLQQFVTGECQDIAQAWALWQSGLLAGLNNVTGNGIGAWAGVGAGGGLKESSQFNVTHSWPHSDPAGYWNTLKAAITSELKKQFSAYASSYAFSSVPYLGSSTAGPTSPGVFVAVNTPGTLVAYGAGQAPTAVGQGIQGQLPGNWKTDVLPLFLDALGTAVQQAFQRWQESAQVSGDTATGPSSPGSGTGAGVSAGTGTIS